MRPTLLAIALTAASTIVSPVDAAPAMRPAAATPQAAPSRSAILPDSAIHAILQERVASGVVPGIVVGVLDADGTRRFVTAGRSGTDRPLDRRTLFEIGSITKAFTGALLAEMAERGEVSLDDSVARLLPDSVRVPDFSGREITLVDIATHTSGLPRLPDNFSPADPTNPYADYSVEYLYDFLADHSLRRPPGSEYEYSNLGMGLLGHALALRIGTDYADAVRMRITDPLGMNDTRIELAGDRRSRLATGHDQGGKAVPNWDIPTLAGAGALRSTAEDMLIFLGAHLHPPETALGRGMRIAQQRHSPENTRPVGLAWHINGEGDGTFVWHNGGTGGYHSFAGFVPARGIAVVVLANSSANIDDIGVHLLDPSSPLRRERAEVPVPREILEDYAGTYDLTAEVALEVTLADGRLYAQITGQSPYPIFAASDSTFFLRVVEAEVTFRRNDEGTVTELVLRQNGRETVGRRRRE